MTENMVGHKLGEFALTRTYRGHAADKKHQRIVGVRTMHAVAKLRYAHLGGSKRADWLPIRSGAAG